MPETCKACGEPFDPPDSIGSDSSLCQMRWESDCADKWWWNLETTAMPEITEQRLRDLCNNPPPGAVHWEWETLVDYLTRETDSSDAYVLNLMLADLDARTAKAKLESSLPPAPIGVDAKQWRESMQSLCEASADDNIVMIGIDRDVARHLYAMALGRAATHEAKAREVSSGERPPVESRRSIDTRDGRWVEVPVPGKTVLVRASNLPSTLAETREGANVRIEYAVLDDDGGDEVAEQKPFNMNISEEWLKKMADAEGSGFTSVGGLAVELGLPVAKPAPDLLRAYIRRNPHPECLPSMLFRATMPGGGNTWHATYEAAAAAILEAAGKAVGDE